MQKSKRGWRRCYIAKVPSNEIKFKWICDHYDIHLHGTCYYNNEVCEFKVDDNNDDIYRIYKLNHRGKIRWWLRQKMFEFMIGYSWTYKKGKRLWNTGHDKRPEWLRRVFHKVYYWEFSRM
jgi:hypothetical protein